MTELTKEQQAFYSKSINEQDMVTLSQIMDMFSDLAGTLNVTLPAGRYKSLVFTKLEESAMFATKAFSHK